jgi:hypothetical protein
MAGAPTTRVMVPTTRGTMVEALTVVSGMFGRKQGEGPNCRAEAPAPWVNDIQLISQVASRPEPRTGFWPTHLAHAQEAVHEEESYLIAPTLRI